MLHAVTKQQAVHGKIDSLCDLRTSKPVTVPANSHVIIISRQALAREGEYKMHPVCVCMRVCVSVSYRFLKNSYSYRFFVN